MSASVWRMCTSILAAGEPSRAASFGDAWLTAPNGVLESGRVAFTATGPVDAAGGGHEARICICVPGPIVSFGFAATATPP